MKIIVGLGNPGVQYEETPHNLGFLVLNQLASDASVNWNFQECFALVAKVKSKEIGLLLAKPQTYMNCSGQSVKHLLSKYRVTLDNLVVVCDDLALPFGSIRIKANGSHGGHNGLRSVINCIESQEFTRVRLGIDPAFEVVDASSYVLSPIGKDYSERVKQMVLNGKKAVESVCDRGVQQAMNSFN